MSSRLEELVRSAHEMARWQFEAEGFVTPSLWLTYEDKTGVVLNHSDLLLIASADEPTRVKALALFKAMTFLAMDCPYYAVVSTSEYMKIPPNSGETTIEIGTMAMTIAGERLVLESRILVKGDDCRRVLAGPPVLTPIYPTDNYGFVEYLFPTDEQRNAVFSVIESDEAYDHLRAASIATLAQYTNSPKGAN